MKIRQVSVKSASHESSSAGVTTAKPFLQALIVVSLQIRLNHRALVPKAACPGDCESQASRNRRRALSSKVTMRAFRVRAASSAPGYVSRSNPTERFCRPSAANAIANACCAPLVMSTRSGATFMPRWFSSRATKLRRPTAPSGHPYCSASSPFIASRNAAANCLLGKRLGSGKPPANEMSSARVAAVRRRRSCWVSGRAGETQASSKFTGRHDASHAPNAVVGNSTGTDHACLTFASWKAAPTPDRRAALERSA